MAGQVEIINIALSHISQKPIQSISEVSTQAQAAVRIWEVCLKDTLGELNWSFASVAVALALVSNYTPLHYDYAYAYPSNCMGLWLVYNDATTKINIGEQFRVMYDPTGHQKVVVTDCEDAYGEYTYYLQETTLFSPKFVMALSHKLASILAVSLNGREDQAKAQIVLYNGVISDAKRLSANENTEEKSQDNPFVDAR